jgi:hypothetical protein
MWSNSPTIWLLQPYLLVLMILKSSSINFWFIILWVLVLPNHWLIYCYWVRITPTTHGICFNIDWQLVLVSNIKKIFWMFTFALVPHLLGQLFLLISRISCSPCTFSSHVLSQLVSYLLCQLVCKEICKSGSDLLSTPKSFCNQLQKK